MSHHAEWIGDDDDLTLTVPLANAFGGHYRSEQDTDVVLHPAYAAESVTEELQIHGDIELWPAPAPVYARAELFPTAEPAGSFPTVEPARSFPTAEPAQFFPTAAASAFAPAPVRSRSHSEISLPSPRARFDSDTSVSTWKKTMPALRRMVGLPIVPGWAPAPVPSAPPPRPNMASTSPAGWSPLLLIAGSVCLVAMVVMTIVGFGSRAAEASRAAHTRIVSATGQDGAAVVSGRVFVDGSAECESTPCELELTTGVHWITVRAPGYETPPSRSIHAGVDEATNVSFALIPSADAPAAAAAEAAAAAPPAPEPVAAALTAALLPALSPPAPSPAARPTPAFVRPAAAAARLNVNAIPAANVVLDGRPVGRTPLMGLKVKPGPHSLVFIGPGGKRAVRSTVVGAGRSVTVAARL